MPIIKIAEDTPTHFWGKEAAGILFICQEDQTMLLLLRSSWVNEPNTWGIPGGKVEGNEDPFEAALRETEEEIFAGNNLFPQYESKDNIVFQKDKFKYTTFILSVSKKEKKKLTDSISLDDENTDFKWFPYEALPSNLHFGVKHIKQKLQDNPDFFELNDPKDEFDWVSKDIVSIIRKSKDINNYLNIFHPAISLLKNKEKTILVGTDQEQQEKQNEEFVKNMINELNQILPKISDNLKPKLQEIIRKLTKNPSKIEDNRKINKYLYHGTNFVDALSILKDNTFKKATSFERVCLSTDVNSSMKFGDTIFAFDAKKMIKKYKAKLMTYTDIDKGTSWKSEDDPVNPRMSTLYLKEKELFIRPLPLTFDDEDLVKMIFVSSYYKDSISNRAKQILENASNKPVQLMNVASHSELAKPKTYKDDVILNSKLGSSLKHLAIQIKQGLESLKKTLKEEEDKEKVKEEYDNTAEKSYKGLYYDIIRCEENIDYMIRIDKITLSESTGLKDLKRAIQKSKENYKGNEYIEKYMPDLDNILSNINQMQSLFLELDDEQFEKNILNQSGDDTIKSVWISNNLEKFEIIIQKINVSNEDSEYSNDYSKAISLLELLPKNLLNKISLKTFSKFHYFVFRFDEDTLKLIDENKLSQIVKTIPKEKIEKEINSDSYKTLQFKRDAINYIRDIYNKTFPNNKITIGESELIEPELTDDFIKNIYLRAKAKRVYHPKVFDMIVNHTIPAYTNQNQINSLEPYLNNTISKLEILKPEQYSSVPEYSNSFDGWSLQDLEALYKILFNKDLPGS